MIRVSQALLVLAAIGLWVASRLPWVVLRSFDGLGQPRTTTLSGAMWSTALVPLAVLLVAGALAALAVRGWALRVLAVVVAAGSAGAGYLAMALWRTPDVSVRAADLAEVPVASLVGASRQYWGSSITLVAAVMVLVAAVLLMRAAVHGAAGTGRYASPAQRRATVAEGDSGDKMSERTMWDALDEGGDPTGDSESEGRCG